MSEISALYFDGKTASGKTVSLSCSGDGRLRIFGLEPAVEIAIDQLTVQPRIGNAARSVLLPGGEKIEIRDNDFVDQWLLGKARGGWLRYVHLIESRWHYVLTAILSMAGFSWWFLAYGIPALATYVAFSLPESTDEFLGEGSIQAMDASFFMPTRLSEAEQQHWRDIFSGMVTKLTDSHHYQLLFRQSPRVGANAFALPSGIVVITDEMLALAENDEQIVSVLAHEIGHVVHRHGLRTALQNSAAGLLVAVVVGDVLSSSSIAATLPTVLIHAKYSRNFETEADDYSYQYLKRNNIDPRRFAEIMTLLEKKNANEGNDILNYFSSHPVTQERIQRFAD